MKTVDLSVVIRPGISPNQRVPAPTINYTRHTDAASLNGMVNVFAGSDKDDFGPYGWASERVVISTHTGTHMNAPWHFGAEREDGTEALKIDAFPLQWGFCPGVVLDLTHLPDGFALTVREIERALECAGRALMPLDIILLKDGAQSGAPPRVSMTAEVLVWLSGQGIHVIGTQAAGIADEARAAACSSVCSGKDIFVIECMDHLAELPADGSLVACFPQKVERGSAAWCRALAQLE